MEGARLNEHRRFPFYVNQGWVTVVSAAADHNTYYLIIFSINSDKNWVHTYTLGDFFPQTHLVTLTVDSISSFSRIISLPRYLW
jgi:hypothetical protein